MEQVFKDLKFAMMIHSYTDTLTNETEVAEKMPAGTWQNKGQKVGLVWKIERKKLIINADPCLLFILVNFLIWTTSK
jgi:hypothetical protein